MPLVEANTKQLWTSCLGFGKPPWRNPLSNTELSLWGHWDSSSVSTCPLGYAMLQQLSSNYDQLFRRLKLFDLFGVSGWCHYLFEHTRGTHWTLASSPQMLQAPWTKAQTFKMWIFQGKDWVLGALSHRKVCSQAVITWRPLPNVPNPWCIQPSRVSLDSWDTIDASLRTSPKSKTPCMNMQEVTQPRKRRNG